MLNYSTIGDGSNTIFVLHGIFGSLRNWRSFALQLQRENSNYRIVLIDLRCHGGSHSQEPPHSLAACANDLVELGESIGHPEIVIGHSFGGKVALCYGRIARPKQIWSLDSPPYYYNQDLSDAQRILTLLKSVPLPLKNRKELVDFFLQRGFSLDFGRWMSTNLQPEEGGYGWRFDLEGISDLLSDYFVQDLWHMVESPPANTAVHVVRADESHRWDPQAIARLDVLGDNSVHVLQGSGHWVHVDNPKGLLRILGDHLPH